MNSTSTNAGGWDACERREWCNGEFKESFPDTLKPIFKQMAVTTAKGPGAATVVSEDTFALPAEKEVFGTNMHGDSTAEGSLFQLEHFKTASNRIKKQNGATTWWQERSPTYDNSNCFCFVYKDGSAENDLADAGYSLAPICCI